MENTHTQAGLDFFLRNLSKYLIMCSHMFENKITRKSEAKKIRSLSLMDQFVAY